MVAESGGYGSRRVSCAWVRLVLEASLVYLVGGW